MQPLSMVWGSPIRVGVCLENVASEEFISLYAAGNMLWSPSFLIRLSRAVHIYAMAPDEKFLTLTSGCAFFGIAQGAQKWA